tara:strand:+ start:2857 stop:3042 length:186 start_codon:yes stop_codon:yes gene_type:complete
MPVVLTEFQLGYQMAIEQTEHMSTREVVHSISSFRFDAPDTDYQRGFLEGMEQYYKSLGKV